MFCSAQAGTSSFSFVLLLVCGRVFRRGSRSRVVDLEKVKNEVIKAQIRLSDGQVLDWDLPLLLHSPRLQTLLRFLLLPAPKWTLSHQQSRLKSHIAPSFCLVGALSPSSPCFCPKRAISVFPGFSTTVPTAFSTPSPNSLPRRTLVLLLRYEAFAFPFQPGVVWKLTSWFGLCFPSRLCRIDVTAAPQCSTEPN